MIIKHRPWGGVLLCYNIIMDYLMVFFVVGIGLIFGSFLSVLITRLDRKKGIISGRSECPHCFHKLSWHDLVPLISFIFLGGKCRYCRARISLLYPLLELTVAVVLIVFFIINGWTLNAHDYYNIVLLVLLVSLVFFDYLYLLLPDKIIIIIGAVALIYNFLYQPNRLTHLFIFGFLFALGFAILYLASKGRAIGFGDVKLAFIIGLILGYPLGLLAIIFAIWGGALWGLILMLFGKATRKTALPFGSFLSATTIIFIIFSDAIQKKINTTWFL